MGDISELGPVNKAILRWCSATGMRENKAKREGLAMGKYRADAEAIRKLRKHKDIKWAPEKGWCVSLGVPIGNELDETKWWGE
eukprot:5278426-Prymnesium_polylepis.1